MRNETDEMREEFIFEKLNVYQKSLELSIEICKLCSVFPIKYSRIRDQLIGAIVSIPLNIAEGNGRKTNKDKINFYKIARSSSFECVPLLDICLALGLINDADKRRIRNIISEISRMLSGLMNYQNNK
ncbi:MAG: four helix bundle protein [Patescibacteria group bacterium]